MGYRHEPINSPSTPSKARSRGALRPIAVLLFAAILALLIVGALVRSGARSSVYAAEGISIPPPSYGLEARRATPAYLNIDFNASRNQPPLERYHVENAFPKLSFQDPTMLVAVPRSNKLCVIGREGTVECFDNRPDAAAKTLVLDIRDHCQGWDDCGLLGIAFHPDFGKPGSPNRGYFYVWFNYSDNPTHGPNRPDSDIFTKDRLVRYTIPDGQDVADPTSAQIIIDQGDNNLWHNGGGMFFGPDGFLYLSLGDEGGSDNQYQNAQRIDKSLFSGLIRIDVDQNPIRSHPIPRQPINGKTAHYFIPNDNPWVGRPNAMEEFWCLGLRNPHRVTQDPVTHIIWCGDVGQDLWEEVDILEKGGNYQWAYQEGNHPGPDAKPDPADLIGTEKPPIYDYHHDNGNFCVIGGYVYRGRLWPELVGKYIFGDNVSGRIWAMSGGAEGHVQLTELARMPRRAYSGLSSFGVDANNEIYMCQMGVQDGGIFHLALPRSEPLPPLLSQTHAFDDLKSLKPAAQLIPYTVNQPFWSDGAAKTRWIALPGNPPFNNDAERITFSPTGSFTFPAGTVFVKHFDLAVDDREPKVTRRLETRLLVRDPQGGVFGAAYRWRDDGSDAIRIDGPTNEDIPIISREPIPALQGDDIGNAPVASQFQVFPSGCQIISGGRDSSPYQDSVAMASMPHSGDFDLRVRVDAFQSANTYAKAGLMYRQSNQFNSPFFCAFARPGDAQSPANFGLILRDSRGAFIKTIFSGGQTSYPNTWLRIRRLGIDFTGFSSNDGLHWNELGSFTLDVQADELLGVAVANSGVDPYTPASARFADLTFLRDQTWYYPSEADCLTCHSQSAQSVLGVNARQLNGNFSYPNGRTDNQLLAWTHIGMFANVTENQVLASPKLAAIHDLSASLQERARSYLDANCAYCHRPGVAGGSFDARFDTPWENQNFLTAQVRNPIGLAGARIIAPGDLQHSMILLRVQSLASNQMMPPLARNRIDDEGANLLEEWIKGLPMQK